MLVWIHPSSVAGFAVTSRISINIYPCLACLVSSSPSRPVQRVTYVLRILVQLAQVTDSSGNMRPYTITRFNLIPSCRTGVGVRVMTSNSSEKAWKARCLASDDEVFVVADDVWTC